MRLSTKGCYGLRAMLELGQNFGNGPVLMSAIAKNQGISRKYLHALLTMLRSAGLVNSVRGALGGYVLARDPSLIKVKDIVQVLEGTITFADCVRDESLCARSGKCAGHELWKSMTTALDTLLSSMTLQDLIKIQLQKESPISMYYI